MQPLNFTLSRSSHFDLNKSFAFGKKYPVSDCQVFLRFQSCPSKSLRSVLDERPRFKKKLENYERKKCHPFSVLKIVEKA